MSNAAIKWALGLDPEVIGPTERFVLVVLADYSDIKTFTCYPSQATLARRTSFAERTVRAALARLESGGWIRRQRRQSARGYRTSDFVILLVSRETQPEEATAPAGIPRQSLPAPGSREPSELEPLEEPEESRAPSVGSLMTEAITNAMGLTPDQLGDPTAQMAALEIKDRQPDQGRYSEAFLGFWAKWPNKIGKAEAATEFDKALKRASREVILAGVDTLVAHVEHERTHGFKDHSYPSPVRWLMGDRWDDEYAEKATEGMSDADKKYFDQLDIERARTAHV